MTSWEWACKWKSREWVVKGSFFPVSLSMNFFKGIRTMWKVFLTRDIKSLKISWMVNSEVGRNKLDNHDRNYYYHQFLVSLNKIKVVKNVWKKCITKNWVGKNYLLQPPLLISIYTPILMMSLCLKFVHYFLKHITEIIQFKV